MLRLSFGNVPIRYRKRSGNGAGMERKWGGKGAEMERERGGNCTDWTDWTDENARMPFGLIYRQGPKEGKNETERVKDWG